MARTGNRRHSGPMPPSPSPSRFRSSNNTANRASRGPVARPATVVTTPRSTTRYFQRVENGFGIFAPEPASGPSTGETSSSARKRRSEIGEGSSRSSKKAKYGGPFVSPLRRTTLQGIQYESDPQRLRSPRLPRHRGLQDNRQHSAQTQQQLNSRAGSASSPLSHFYAIEYDDRANGLPDYEQYEREEMDRLQSQIQRTNSSLGASGGNGNVLNQITDEHDSLELVHRPYSTGDTPQPQSPLSQSDDGLGHGIRGYPDPAVHKTRRENPSQQEASGGNQSSSTKDEDGEDSLYEADGETSDSTEPQPRSERAMKPATTNHYEESEDEGLYQSRRNNHDATFRQAFALGQEDGRAGTQHQIAALQRQMDDQIARIRQEADEEIDRNWIRAHDEGNLEGWNQGYASGRNENYQQGYGTGRQDEARTQQIAIDTALDQQDRRHQEEVLAAHGEGQRGGYDDGYDDGRRDTQDFYEGEIHRSAVAHADGLVDLARRHRDRNQIAYERGRSDRDQEVLGLLAASAMRTPPIYVEEEEDENEWDDFDGGRSREGRPFTKDD